MKKYVVFDESGVIVRTGNCSANHIALQAIYPGETATENLEDWTREEHYWDGSKFNSKVEMPFEYDANPIAADGVDAAIIGGIPFGTVVHYSIDDVGGVGHANVDDGIFEFSIDVPGVYQLILVNPLHLDTVVQVIAE